MESLAAFRHVSPSRYRSSQYYVENEDESAPSTPCYISAPTSPRRGSAREVEEEPLGEVRAAIPFTWESTPGTPKSRESRTHGDVTSSGTEASGPGSRSSSPSPDRGYSRQSSYNFDFSGARFTPQETPALSNNVPFATAEELFFHGQLLPLRLPPRLQVVRDFRESLASSSDVSKHGSFRNSLSPPLSPRSDSPVMGPETRIRDTPAWSMQPVPVPKVVASENRRARSLSPMRMFKRDQPEVQDLFSEKFLFTSEASSSVSSTSSSSSRDERNAENSKKFWPPFEEKQYKPNTFNGIFPSDKPSASPKIDVSKLSSKEVIRKAERFKASEGFKSLPRILSRKESVVTKQDKEGPNSRMVQRTRERMGLAPQLFRSNAKSISRTPIAVQAKPTVREHGSAAVFPFRFKMVTACLGRPASGSPHSP